MGIHELAGGIGHDNDTGSHLCRARHSAIRWPWGLSQIRSLAKGEKSKRSGSRPQWRRWLSSMSFPSVSTAPARDRDGRAVVASRKFARGAELGRRVGAQSRGAQTNLPCDASAADECLLSGVIRTTFVGPRRILQQPAQLANLAAGGAEPILCRRHDRRHLPDLGQ